ncbi:putative potassium transport system protein kup [Bradyrhizobium sp. RD5-C2]|nr:putative potassium transport system protein kup [Bradyrhizobium sp. RD5-C2]
MNDGAAGDGAAPVASTEAKASDPVRAALVLGALGVVFGDIGTSPIYAFRESIKASGTSGNMNVIFGVLSLVFWAVILVVAVKYVLIVMRADNDGEGGTMALLSLVLPKLRNMRRALLTIGLVGASLFFGDAMITPAISVLSAVEGVEIVTPLLKPYVVPLAATILVGLFLIQSRGSASVGRFFGPVMALWFFVLGAAGGWNLIKHPQVLAALNPSYAISFLVHADGWIAFTVLGSVFLALTGGEALYADMGHFGRKSIRLDWFAFVMPALVLNYFGQGALVLSNPDTSINPFFLMFPTSLTVPIVVLTTCATVIASQAVISGAFALVQQAIQLGALPRLDVRQTSDEAVGQVYVPQVNWLLAIAVLGLVFGFRSSEALANAYGIAVAGDMLVTTVLVTTAALVVWQWPLLLIGPIAAFFFMLDATFVVSNAHKIPQGGWFPLLVGSAALTLMLSWRRGREVALARREADAIPLQAFIEELSGPHAPVRVPGKAIYFTTRNDVVPAALSLNLKHNSVVHQNLMFLKITTARVPKVTDSDRISATELAPGLEQVEMRFGFAQKPDVPAALAAHSRELGPSVAQASFFLGREVPVPSLHPDVPLWQETLYAFMTRNAVRAPDYFLIPPARVVELGTKVEM